MTLEDDLLALERRVLVDAGGDFLAAVARLKRMLATGSDPSRELARLAIPAVEQAAKDAAVQAWALGADQAITQADLAGNDANSLDDAALRTRTPPTHLTDPLVGLDVLLHDAKARALQLHGSNVDPETALGPIFQAANTLQSRVVTQVNAASNAAAVEVGDATGSSMVWEAERDACVYCLALAGEVIENPGDPFPAADRYAPVPKSAWTVSRPPLHPHCRCRIAVLADVSYASTLRREADRSILRGFSLESESQAVRLRAAQRLLERGVVAPKTVKAYAVAAIKRGQFPTRDVPDGGPRLAVSRPSR